MDCNDEMGVGQELKQAPAMMLLRWLHRRAPPPSLVVVLTSSYCQGWWVVQGTDFC